MFKKEKMMRRCSAFLCSFILLFLATPCVNASITGWTCGPDGDGAITMNYTTLTPDNGEYLLDMDGQQYWYPAHLAGSFTTSDLLDPTVHIMEGVTNDTDFAWADYHITIGMNNNTFSILSTGVTAPSGWTWNITAPVAGNMPNNGGAGYVGVINYYQGTGSSVAIGNDFDFGFKISFQGNTVFSTEQIPTPEPATIALLGLGAVSVIRRKRV
jgi:hypothetical protein